MPAPALTLAAMMLYAQSDQPASPPDEQDIRLVQPSDLPPNFVRGLADHLDRQYARAEQDVEIERLGALLGTWDVDFRLIVSGREFSFARGVGHVDRALGGRGIRTDVTGSITLPGLDLPYAGTGFIRWNADAERYESAWSDALRADLMHRTGTLADGVLSLESVVDGTAIRTDYRLGDPDAIEMRTYQRPAQAEAFVLTGRTVYTRRQPGPELPTYVCFLHPTRPEMAVSGPTNDEQRALAGHVSHIRDATNAGTIVLAGPTTVEPYTGLVIFRARDDDAAAAFMNADPGVAGGIFRARVAPLRMSFRGFDR